MPSFIETASTPSGPAASGSARDPHPASALDRLHAALRTEAATLAVRGPRSFSALPGEPAEHGVDESWRERCFQQLLASRPGFDPGDALRMALVLSRDPAFAECGPESVAVAACRLLDRTDAAVPNAITVAR